MTDPMGFLMHLLAAGIARGTPLLFATLGEIHAERAGVINLGVEGMMLTGAMAGFAAAHATGSATLGVLAGMAAAAGLSLLYAFAVITLRADQVVSGLALTFTGAGLASVYGAPLVEVRQAVAQVPAVRVPLLDDIPFVGPILFQQNLLVYVGLLLTVLSAVFFRVTRHGLHVRAVGEHPLAADSLGVSVVRIRYVSVVYGGLLAGLGGASLSLAITPGWVDGMTAGQGWIAVGLVIFAGWSPLRAALGAYLFGTIRRLPLDLQGLQGIPALQNPALGYFLNMLPYLFTILVVVAASKSTRLRRIGAPSALGRPFVRGERAA